MIFDTSSDNIILLSYPSGGFGNFLYHVLTTFADQTVKVKSKFNFNINGNSHNTQKYTSIYFHEPEVYTPRIFVDYLDKKILVLCDNGINNDSYTKINKVFPNATIVRTVIDEEVRPVIYKTCVIKAMGSNVLQETANQVKNRWVDSNDYSVRENFTLLYHNWPFAWDADPNCVNLSLKKLFSDPVSCITNLITDVGMSVLPGLDELCNDWYKTNKSYFDIVANWRNIEFALDHNQPFDINSINDLHDQGYLNYCIERKFNVTIPVYDYRNWFKSTIEIQEMVQRLK
jgi:hypothetical protein